MLIDIREKYLHGPWRSKTAQAFGPFNDDGRSRVIEYFFKTEAFEPAGVDAIQVDVVYRNAALILIDESEGWTGNLARVLHPKSFCKSFCEERLTRTELTIKQDMRRQPQGKRKLPCDVEGLFVRGRGNF